ncbi:hypothetical protein [Bradyrhizobium sp. SEMIA]|uniref:hypothetical protein n=1 Tax=Bradyrhizobium sp. SEMIA TaxID=2597515 RepID=UPI003A0FCADC
MRDRIIRRAVTLLSCEGGVGKSILTLQLCCAHALAPWFGSLPSPDRQSISTPKTTSLNCTSGWKRSAPVSASHSRSWTTAACTSCRSRAKTRCSACRIVRAYPADCLFEELLLTANNIMPVLLVLNSAADLFAGNENSRSEVRQFVGLPTTQCWTFRRWLQRCTRTTFLCCSIFLQES